MTAKPDSSRQPAACTQETINVTVDDGRASVSAARRADRGVEDDWNAVMGSESTTTLKVVWHAPENTGDAINRTTTWSTRRAPRPSLDGDDDT